MLDTQATPEQVPVLPATLDTEAEALLLRRPTADGRLQVLRLWHAPARLADGTPLWVGTTQTLEFAHPLSGLFGIWLPVADGDRHADEALQAGGVALPAPVRGLMRLAAKVMTTTAHRV